MWLQFATKNSLWHSRNISRQGFMHPKANTHITANTHIQGTQTHVCTNTCTQTCTQAPKNPAGFGSHALTSGSQSKGCCSPAYNSTTDPLCSSCKFCSFSSGLRRVLCCFVKRRRRSRGARGQRSETTVCVWPLNHCVCMKAGIVHVSLCVCACVVCDPLRYMCI